MGSTVKVHYTGTLLDGSKFDSSRDRPGFFEFKIGKGQVIKGWDTGVATMHKGEKSLLTCRADYAYGARGSPPKIPANATLQFEVELFSWKKDKFEMSDAEKLAEAELLKANGTEAFKAKRFAEAQDSYAQAAELISAPYVSPAGKEAHSSQLLVSCWLNEAQCYLLMKEWEGADTACSNVLVDEPQNVKALFRRGKARIELGDFGGAKTDLREANKLDPKNKEVRELFVAAGDREKASKAAEKGIYNKMFK